MRHLLREAGLQGEVEVQSAGTGGWHVGSPPDVRAAEAARRRGIVLDGSARQVAHSDFEAFDLIIAMDRSNLRDLRAIAPDHARDRIRLLRPVEDGCPDEADVPDPYYGGDRGFDDVLDLVTEACERLLDEILTQRAQAAPTHDGAGRPCGSRGQAT